jgi:Zn-dependent metalloprotease
MVRCARHPVCHIIPPRILMRIAEEGDAEARTAAIDTLTASAAIRARRSVVTQVVQQLDVGLRELAFLAPPAGEANTVFDVHHGGTLPGERKRGQGDPESSDKAVNEAFDGAHLTHAFYKDVYGRESLDDHGLELVSSVHFANNFNNAGWNGSQMIYGDGDGVSFKIGSLTALDVVGHELTHGVTEFTAGLVYHKASGALNESFSDVFGSLVKQHKHGQTADQADWLIGPGIFTSASQGKALRSLEAPGTANVFDDQPAHMSGFVELPDNSLPGNDNGGVHTNSGIPNKAFHLAATAIGGKAWEKAGLIWYDALTKVLRSDSDFRDAANATLRTAEERFGANGAEHDAVGNAWAEVGVL